MPPKAAPKKGGAEELDLSDLPTLPVANIATAAIVYGKFTTTETRNKISEHVSKQLAEKERIK